jgi:hypothetical protein
MKRGYSPDCSCMYCSGRRREAEEDAKQVAEEPAVLTPADFGTALSLMRARND